MEFSYYYTLEYLPTRYVASDNDWNNRHAVWDFKDGICHESIANDMVEIIKHIADGHESEYIICFIPASTTDKTTRRYGTVSRKLADRTGVKTSLCAISKTSDTESGHISGKSSNPTTDFVFDNNCFNGKKVILIDDVITRGRTFTDTAVKLINKGAESVVGLFVAKTVNPS